MGASPIRVQDGLRPDIQRPALELGGVCPVRAMPSIAHRRNARSSGILRRSDGLWFRITVGAGA
jgi:hypothetical protein